jgi:hypothetical protein
MGIGSIGEPESFEPDMQPTQSNETAEPEPQDDAYDDGSR